jgi:dolichol-phosphate mannosyltransferase
MKNSDVYRRIAIIPSCHNTSQLLKVIAGFGKDTVDKICIIIDCATSSDQQQVESIAAKKSIPIHLITNRERRGIGFAIREGIEYAMKEKFDVAIVMAGNGKDQPEEIKRLLTPISAEGFDYVQGSRFLPGGKHVKNPFLRRMFSRLFPFAWTFTTKTRCTDVTNGFRAYKLSIFNDNRINIRQDWLDGYQLEYYIQYKVLTLGYKVREVPVSKIYPFNHKGGYSRISPFRDWWTIVSPLVYLKLGIRK